MNIFDHAYMLVGLALHVFKGELVVLLELRKLIVLVVYLLLEVLVQLGEANKLDVSINLTAWRSSFSCEPQA